MLSALARTLIALCLLAATVGSTAAAAEAQAAPYCEAGQSPRFSFGFADLKAALGAIMGDPVECEHANADNGDTLQQTTTGLAVYRAAANAPEFTDGWNHWALTVQGMIAWAGSDQPPVAAQPALAPPAAPPAQCIDVGADLCLNTAPELADTVALLEQTRTAPPLLRVAAQGNYRVHYGNLPADVLGMFRPSRHDVIMSAVLGDYPTIDRGPVLAHELQHVADWSSLGRQLETTSGCLATETNAFHTESSTWLELRGGRLVPPANDLEAEFNTIARVLQTDPAGFASRLTTAYHDECAGS